MVPQFPLGMKSLMLNTSQSGILQNLKSNRKQTGLLMLDFVLLLNTVSQPHFLLSFGDCHAC